MHHSQTSIQHIREFELSDTEGVISLWEKCGLTRAWNNPHLDIQRKLSVQKELFLVAENAGKIIASVMAGYDGHRGSVNYLAVDPEFMCQGLGRLLMEKVEQALEKIGCPKINLMVRHTNLDVQEFYLSLDYEEQDVKVYGKRLIPD